MNVMILAAGRGERMRPLTDTCPKPLLSVGGQPLIEWLIRALAAAGTTRIVINHAWLGEQIETRLGNGSRFGVQIQYSPESPALETAGGIANALPMLQTDPFVVVNGDIFTDFDFSQLESMARTVMDQNLAGGCLLVDNPPHNHNGDFAIEDGRLRNHGASMLTFAGIAVYRPGFFSGVAPGQNIALRDLLRAAADNNSMAASHWSGEWTDVGTPARLQQLNASIVSGLSNSSTSKGT